MAEVEAVSARFAPFALSCSRIYFSLQQLPDLHFLYQTSLTFFLEIVDRVLASGSRGQCFTRACDVLRLKRP
jgi:dynein heavy chain 1, cytosolic